MSAGPAFDAAKEVRLDPKSYALVQQLYDVDFALYNYSHADLPL